MTTTKHDGTTNEPAPAGGLGTTAVDVQQAADSADRASDHADSAAISAGVAKAAADRLAAPPGPAYLMVIGILGLALIALIVGDLLSALGSQHTVDTSLMSATTLIAGGLIGVLAPTPGK